MVQNRKRGQIRASVSQPFREILGSNKSLTPSLSNSTHKSFFTFPVSRYETGERSLFWANFVSDFEGKWHCMDELNPLVFAINKEGCVSDSFIDTKTSVQSGSRLRVGPSVMESHTASHIEGSASFKLSAR